MNNGWKEGAAGVAILSFGLLLVTLALFAGCASVRAPASGPVQEEAQAEPFDENEELANPELGDLAVSEGLDLADVSEALSLAEAPESPVPGTLQQRFDIKVQDAELHDVVQTLVKGKGLNVIIPRRLEGKITLDVESVTLEEVFDVVLRSYGYSWRIDNRFLIITRGEPISVFRINQAPINEVQSQVERIVGGHGDVLMDAQSRTLTLVNCDPNVTKYVEEYIRAIDVKPPQVVLEVEVVEVKLDSEHSLGVDWTFRDIDLSGWSDLRGAALTNLTPTLEGQVLFAGLSNDHVDILLKALATQGDLTMVSCPKVTAIDRMLSRIEIYDNIPYTEWVKTTDVNALGVAYTEYRPTVAWREVGTRLEIRPEISPDGYVTMLIKPDIEILIGTVGGQPQTNRREGELYARTRDGRTVVIGGFMFDSLTEIVYKVPLLGDIPYIGNLFRMNSTSKVKKELVFFLTPHILTDTSITDFAESERANYRYLTSKPSGLPTVPK